MLKQFIITQGGGLLLTMLPIVLPMIIPNRWMYLLGYRTFGNVLKLITVKTAGRSQLTAVIAQMLNWVLAFFGGAVDRARGLPQREVWEPILSKELNNK